MLIPRGGGGCTFGNTITIGRPRRTGFFTGGSSIDFTLSGLRISAVDGTAFIDNASALTTYADGYHEISIYDSNGYELKGVLKAAGTSEGLGSELITSWTNRTSFEYETLTVNANGYDIDSLISSAVRRIAYSNSILASGRLTRIVITPTVNSGSFAGVQVSEAQSTGNLGVGKISPSGANGTYYYTGTATSGMTHIALDNIGSTAFNASVLMSGKTVTAPSSSGATIVSAKGGTTYNFTSKHASFAFNAASYNVVVRRMR